MSRNLYRIVCDDAREPIGIASSAEAAVLDALNEVSDMRFGSQTSLLDDFAGERLELPNYSRRHQNSISQSRSQFLASIRAGGRKRRFTGGSAFGRAYPDIMAKAGGQRIVFDQVRKMGHLVAQLNLTTRYLAELLSCNPRPDFSVRAATDRLVAPSPEGHHDGTG